jgi:hypothetical protein
MRSIEMSELNVTCPDCGTEIEIAEQLAAPLVAAEREKIVNAAKAKVQKKLEEERAASKEALAEKDAKLKAAAEKELAAIKAKEAAEEAKANAELEVKRQVDAEKGKIAAEAATKATEEIAAKLKAAEEENQRQVEKVKQAQQAELDAIKAKRDAEEAKAEADIIVARKIEEERGKLREQTLKEADEANRLKVAEKDKQLDDMRKQIDALKRKGESGSQQLQGEVQEIDLTDVLQQAFSDDNFERVGKGQRGADVIQSVVGPGGLKCGSILWESKRTTNWTKGWLPKLREDQRSTKADIAALVSEALPEGVEHFDCVDKVWVSSRTAAVPMALALRQGLVETAMSRQAMTGGNSKKELVYNYLTGQEFRQRVSGVAEAYIQMREDLDKEKRAITLQWSKREKQLERLLGSTVGMYGDLQGIIGANLPEVEGLDLPQLEDASDTRLLQATGTDDIAATDEGGDDE